MSNAAISVVCYKSKTLSNGENPLMLRISKDEMSLLMYKK